MFSRPVRSCWKPAPSSNRPASFPRTATSPEVGCNTPQMHLSRVDLPEPFRPRMPTVSPSRTWSETSLRAQNSSEGVRPPWIRRSFSELYFPWASRKRLETSLTSTATSLICLELLGEVALETAEHDQGDHEDHDPGGQHTQVEQGVPGEAVEGQHVDGGVRGHRGLHGDVGVQHALKAEHQRRHGVQEVHP